MSVSRLGIALLAVLSLALGLAISPRSTPLSAELQAITAQRPDAFMENVRQRHYGPDGRLIRTLTADTLIDFGDRAEARLTEPKVWLDRGAQQWTVVSALGQLSTDRTQLQLIGDVIAQRTAPGQVAWHITGAALLWDQTKDQIRSTTSVILTQGDTVSRGDRLMMDLTSNAFTLGEKVTTRWPSSSAQ
jgi:LPS export ABC transporter protein LptC